MAFDEGPRRCNEFGAHLPDVTSSSENAFLTNTFAQIFLDETDRQREGQWVWLNNGQIITYTNWDSVLGEPNNKYGAEHCLQLRDYGKSNDMTCTNTEKLCVNYKFDNLNVYLKMLPKRYR
ncbi:hypothetical protein DPMN_178948 [Dreissena polymorpha]|uniref:C-type lectin domain-containing protein n=1 Tax=Dreissena polymorpha TaxID=45954 RepID=A0A9D4IJ46_DREPO|nr:hypothetical protein DPMN_178948 [Dreissena polymorpha]